MNESLPNVSSCCYEPTKLEHVMGHDGLLTEDIQRVCTNCAAKCHLVYPPCPLNICDGSGLTPKVAYDQDAHMHIPDGEEDCPHTKD